MKKLLVVFLFACIQMMSFAQETVTLTKIGEDKTKELVVERIVGIETKDISGRLSGQVVSINTEGIEFKYKVVVDSMEVEMPHRKDKVYYSELTEDTVAFYSYDQLSALYYSKVKNKKAFKSSEKVVNYLFIGTLGATVVSFATGQEAVGTVAVAGVGVSALAFLYLTIKDSPKKYKFETWEVK